MPLFRINQKVVFFVHIPKTGGTSIEKALATVGRGCLLDNVKYLPSPPQHIHAELYQQLVPAGFYDFGFTVCRNPYARIISEYRHQFTRGKLKGLFGQQGFDAWVDRAFDKYLRDPYVHHNHIRPQVEFLSDSVAVHKFEDGLQPVLELVCSNCGVVPAPPLPREKSFEKTVITVKDQTLSGIAQFYAKDFSRLGYNALCREFALKSGVSIV